MTPLESTVGLTHAPLRGIALYLLGLFLMAIMGAIVKSLGDSFSIGQILLFRNLFAFLPFAFLLWRSGGLRILTTKRPLDHGLRALFGLTSMGFFYYSITRIPLADATIIHYAAPIIVTALSVPLLLERVGVLRWSAVLVGLLGVYVLVDPSGRGVTAGIAAGLISALASAFVTIWVRKLSKTEPVLVIVVFYNLAGIVICALWTLLVGWVTPSPLEFAVLAVFGLLSAAAQYFMTAAFRFAQAVTLTPFEYSVLIFAALLGYVFWEETLEINTLIGAALIVASGLFVIYRETRA